MADSQQALEAAAALEKRLDELRDQEEGWDDLAMCAGIVHSFIGRQAGEPVDPGFVHGVRQHVEEHGSLIVRVAEVGDPALWGPQLTGQWTPDRLREARERSTAQARTLLRKAVG